MIVRTVIFPVSCPLLWILKMILIFPFVQPFNFLGYAKISQDRAASAQGAMSASPNLKKKKSVPELHLTRMQYNSPPLFMGDMLQDPSEYLKLRMVPNPMYTMFFPTYTYL